MFRGYVWGWICPVGVGMSRGVYPGGWVCPRGVGTDPLLLTPSGSYYMYGLQAGGTYLTGMHFCDTSDCHVVPGFAVAAQF